MDGEKGEEWREHREDSQEKGEIQDAITQEEPHDQEVRHMEDPDQGGRSRGIPKTAGEADRPPERKAGERSRSKEGPGTREDRHREREQARPGPRGADYPHRPGKRPNPSRTRSP